MELVKKKIAICNYSFIAFNSKKIREEYSVCMGPLIGADLNEIKSEKRNQEQMRRVFLRENKGRAGLDQFTFHFSKIQIIKHCGNTLK